MYTAGDIIEFEISGTLFHGEIVGIAEDNKLEVSRLKKTQKQEGRIWEFVDDDKWSAINSSYVKKHIKIGDSAPRSDHVKAWKEFGFVPGGDGITFCRIEDEDNTTLPMFHGDESDSESDEEEPSTNPKMHGYADDGFVVPDDEGSEFEFADPDELDEEGAKFVRETHQAVRDYNKWEPQDKQSTAIKKFIDAMDEKAAIQTDNHRFENGKESISTSNPPLKKRKR
jgi:hypothetical protein